MDIAWIKRMTAAEGLSFAVSTIALAISLFSAAEARHATLQARRSEVRAAIQATVQYGSASYAQALCVMRVTDDQTSIAHSRYAEAISALERSATNMNGLRASSDAIQHASESSLTSIELQAEQLDGTFNALRNETTAYKTLLSKEELDRVNSVCAAP